MSCLGKILHNAGDCIRLNLHHNFSCRKRAIHSAAESLGRLQKPVFKGPSQISLRRISFEIDNKILILNVAQPEILCIKPPDETRFCR